MLPQGQAKINQVDVKDIAKASAAVLTNFGHKDKTYNLTGYSYTNMEIVDLLSNIVGKHIVYEDISTEEARQRMKRCSCNNPDWKIEAMMELHQACKDGLMEAYSLDLKNLIGKGPTTFVEFALKNKSTLPSHPRNPKQSKLRIIGGQWRGRKLSFVEASGLRPTSDRIRETLFNW